MNREGTLNADTEGNLTDSEGLTDAGALTTDADALEELRTLVVALDNLYVNVEGIAWAEGRDIVCLLYTSPSPRDQRGSRMPSSA